MKKTTIHAVGEETEPPISVGNPLTAADLAIDQSHMEEFTTGRRRAGRGHLRQAAEGHVLHRARGNQQALAGPALLFPAGGEGPRSLHRRARYRRQQKKEEDVIRPVLIVRYVTMAGDEGLWALKLDPPDGKVKRLEQVGHERAQGRR